MKTRIKLDRKEIRSLLAESGFRQIVVNLLNGDVWGIDYNTWYQGGDRRACWILKNDMFENYDESVPTTTQIKKVCDRIQSVIDMELEDIEQIQDALRV